MNKTIIPALALLMLASCKEEKHPSYCPIFSGFRCVSAYAEQIELKNRLTAGDSIIISAVQQTLGDGLYDAKYDWTLKFKSYDGTIDTTLRQTKKNIVYDYDKSDPVVRVRLFDKAGTLSVTFNAEYQYSSSTVTEINGEQGGIRVYSSSLFGGASGTKQYTVEEKQQ